MKAKRLLAGLVPFLFYVSAAQAQGLDKVVEGAKKEGKVKLGISLRWEVGGKPSGKKLVEAFQARYPFVKAEFERVGGTRERERVLSELAAGKVAYDVTVFTVTQIPTAVQANVIERVDWRSLGIQTQRIGPDGLGVNYQTRIFGIAYNRKLVPEEAGKKLTWEDCADPKWKGKVAMNDSPVHLEIFWQPHIWGRAKTLEHARRLTANQAILERSLEDSMHKVSLGEYPISCGNLQRNYLQQVVFRGATNVGFTAPDPVPATHAGVVFIPRGAPHPNAAKLWVAWSLSDEGQKLLEVVDLSGSPDAPGTEASKVVKGKKIAWYEPEWQLKAAEIRKEILEAMGLPVVR
jgi:iron(III) transport system substrate-binding protein